MQIQRAGQRQHREADQGDPRLAQQQPEVVEVRADQPPERVIAACAWFAAALRFGDRHVAARGKLMNCPSVLYETRQDGRVQTSPDDAGSSSLLVIMAATWGTSATGSIAQARY